MVPLMVAPSMSPFESIDWVKKYAPWLEIRRYGLSIRPILANGRAIKEVFTMSSSLVLRGVLRGLVSWDTAYKVAASVIVSSMYLPSPSVPAMREVILGEVVSKDWIAFAVAPFCKNSKAVEPKSLAPIEPKRLNAFFNMPAPAKKPRVVPV